MSREIKFRAWALEIGTDNNKTWAPFSLELLKEDTHTNWTDNTIFMQYTGLKDKNGKEIYEGDVVENVLTIREFICPKNSHDCYYRNVKRKTRGSVKWDHHWACWDFTEKTERGVLEIIGNIYENPELLNNVG